ncbi:aminotransferase class V-fold PLP-dependent enzyme [Rhodoligotrophos ferricapiens]|uniref:aminotransferase class V-fold PLP-dependent enzyme n=1 Tax=Rhodoligotrophos ferricapiens TaxID=3069264 RepID=UPI00315D5854
MSLIDKLRGDIIGGGAGIPGPFGTRPLIYADFTASGRSLRSIENFIDDEILPFYANPHSRQSFTGRQTGTLIEEAREIIARSIGAGPFDAVLFCGTGATDAIAKLIALLDLKPGRASRELTDRDCPVVFIGPYEHHSNELPWRECDIDLIVICEDAQGQPDLSWLEAHLREIRPGRPIYGSFSAASNVTGIRTPIDEICRMLHAYGGLAFWDFAAAGPYDAIDMSVGPDSATWKDAVFISPHKFLGGPDTPGVLAVKRSIVRRCVPCKPGGGTVQYVTPFDHVYYDELERREEGGTPASIAAMRAALAFTVKAAVGVEQIRAIEDRLVERALSAWRDVPGILVLGSGSQSRLAVFSLMIKAGRRFLHHAFVVQLLNDLFGIQVRGGLFCAGPYAHRLLGINQSQSKQLFEVAGAHGVIARPGWIRLNFHYLMSDEEADYIIAAVRFIAEHGQAFLPLYEFCMRTGRWRHRHYGDAPIRRLRDFEAMLTGRDFRPPCLEPAGEKPLQSYLEEADELVRRLPALAEDGRTAVELPSAIEAVRWFWIPADYCRDDLFSCSPMEEAATPAQQFQSALA